MNWLRLERNHFSMVSYIVVSMAHAAEVLFVDQAYTSKRCRNRCDTIEVKTTVAL